MTNAPDYLVPAVPEPHALRAAAEQAAPLVFRTDVTRPGFALIDFGDGLDARRFRALLLGLADGLGRAYEGEFGRPLLLRSTDRFDQQVSTEAHRDGGPDESVLVLGYEPTEVDSRVSLVDYTRAALDRGLAPAEFLVRFNPITAAGRDALAGYATDVTAFDRTRYQALVINNGCADLVQRDRGMLGVLHRAVMLTPSPQKTRHVNSLMLVTAEPGTPPPLAAADVRAFLDDAAPRSG